MAQNTLISGLVKIYNIISSFFVFYTCLVLFSPIVLLLVLYRLCISVIFKLCYNGRYKLTGCSEGIYAIDSFANVLTITFFCYLDGPTDLANLQQRFSNTFLNYRDNKSGAKPYEILLCAIVRKWGFMCFENKRKSFNVKNHVKICPGVDPKRVLSEAEMFENVGKMADDLWPEDQPRWEVLLFPKLKLDTDPESKMCSGVCLKFHHAYVDGISLAQISRNVFLDQPPPKLCFDPVHPPIPRTPWYVRLWWWILVVIMGPYATTRLTPSQEHNVFYEGPLKGNKFFGRSRSPIPMEIVKKIRQTFDCCTSAIQHSAMLGAMNKMAVRKGFPVPAELIGAATFAHLPYKNEYPTNHIYFGMDKVSVGIVNPLLRLSAVDKYYKRMATTVYDKIASGLFLKISGVFPASLVEKSLGSIKCSYFVSNVPGIAGKGSVQGNPILAFFGLPPVINGIRYGAGVGMYENKFAFGFTFEESNLIKGRQDVEDFICYFEKEIEYLSSVTELNYR